MKRIHFLFLAIFSLLFNIGFAQWSAINLVSNKAALDFNFLTDDLGYALMLEGTSGVRTLEKTTDGGLTWVPLNLPIGNEFQDMYFHADGHGVVVFRSVQNQVQPTKIFQTETDGMSWQDISPDTTAVGIGNAQCHFVNADTGFLATDVMFYATKDGGNSWQSQNIGRYTISMHFLDSEIGLLGTFDGTFNYFGSILTTTDGGMTWDSLNFTENQTVIGEVKQLTATTAYAAPVKWGASGNYKFFKTTDNGASWDTLFTPTRTPSAYLRDINFRDLQNGALVLTGSMGGNYIYHTIDGGQNWIYRDSIHTFGVEDLELTPNSGYLGGALGSFYKLSGPLAIQESVDKKMRIYPNPVAAGQTLHWEMDEMYQALQLVDLSGKIVHEATLTKNEFAMPALPRGIYFARFYGSGNSTSFKLLVE